MAEIFYHGVLDFSSLPVKPRQWMHLSSTNFRYVWNVSSWNIKMVNAIAFDPYTHGYYKVTERVGADEETLEFKVTHMWE